MHQLLLLHGALGSSSQLQPLAESLSDYCHVHLFDFPGHGGKEIPPDFSIRSFADSVVKHLDKHHLLKVSVFGYSMGGYVAMYLAKHYPALIDHVATLATKFEWNELIVEKELKMLQAHTIEQKLPSFATELKQRHAPQDWKLVLNKTSAMLSELGKENPLTAADFATITKPSMLMVGDRDKMVTLDETVAVYKQLPNARLAVLPATPHPMEQVNMKMLEMHIRDFIGN